MKKHLLAALLIGCAITAVGCGSKEKETEAVKPAETAAARETQAAETQAPAAETEAPAAETEAAAAETEAAAAETEAAAVETEAAAVETEAAAVETEAEVVETEAEVVETEAEAVETEEAAETESEVYDHEETESEIYDFTETETEYEVIPKPVFDVEDYLEIDDDAYKDITILIPAAQKVTDEEVNEEIESAFNYLENYDELLDKKTKGKVELGDTVNIDYVGTKDGVEFDGGSAEGYDLEIGSGTFIDGFEDGLIGKEIGSEVDLNLTFPEDYGVEELNGADVVFHVTINYVGSMPELTDEIAEELSGGEYDNVEDYVESVRGELQAGYDEDYQNSAYNEIMGKLIELYPIEEYPEENIEYTINQYLEQLAAYASMYGMSVEDFISAAYGMAEDELREQELIPSAQSTLAQEIILTSIANKEGITLTDSELDKILQDYADQYGVTVDELLGGTDRESARSSELQRKVMEWLFENVNIEEIEETEVPELFGNETEAETDMAADVETEAETDIAADIETEAETDIPADTEAEAETEKSVSAKTEKKTTDTKKK